MAETQVWNFPKSQDQVPEPQDCNPPRPLGARAVANYLVLRLPGFKSLPTTHQLLTLDYLSLLRNGDHADFHLRGVL